MSFTTITQAAGPAMRPYHHRAQLVLRREEWAKWLDLTADVGPILGREYDHVLPNSRGGESSFDNVIVTCAPCNFGRIEWTLDEVGLIDPRIGPPFPSWGAAVAWAGLEYFF